MNGHVEASTSSNPSSILPASYHPHPRPKPIQTDLFDRLDPFSVKQELHDALGENGLPYWKAMNAYLLGQMGRAEMAEVVKEFLKGRLCEYEGGLFGVCPHYKRYTADSQ